MMFFRSLYSLLVILACLIAVAVAKKEEEDQALKDLYMGMAGLKEAANNPALLAQLMRDLQDPEMMAEAKKMMDNPQFQKKMKEMSNTNDFKEATQKSIDMMKDPAKAAEMEARYEHMMKVGNQQLKNAEKSVMEDAMAAMANPEVMAEMSRMIKDPSFQQQLADMAKDPTFKSYIDAMQDMMKDPEKRARMEKIGEAMRANL
ncbi:hypothetical protein IV203_036176 [Nitzschia inconspicua]|uniref:Uncharacterized protein n=1 Tax=Nitzschia inconspicua TaxID=303405 RepID=A0A9K3PVM6_9STRA|nr:hypothetical protein IV203_036176 [Nitzschia inconspicua]